MNRQLQQLLKFVYMRLYFYRRKRTSKKLKVLTSIADIAYSLIIPLIKSENHILILYQHWYTCANKCQPSLSLTFFTKV